MTLKVKSVLKFLTRDWSFGDPSAKRFGPTVKFLAGNALRIGLLEVQYLKALVSSLHLPRLQKSANPAALRANTATLTPESDTKFNSNSEPILKMSNRYAQGRQEGSKSFTKTQRKYMIVASDESPNPNTTLSNSLRQSISKQSDAATANSSSAVSTSRFQMGANGVCVSSKAHDGNFVNYLPQDEAVASGLPAYEGGLEPVESQRVVDLLNRELSRLLKLSAKEFWREVARDTSLHEFLDSFLKFRSRWYDFPHRRVKGIIAGVIVGEFELCRRVFMVLYRISSNRDPHARAADSLSAKDHEGKKVARPAKAV